MQYWKQTRIDLSLLRSFLLLTGGLLLGLTPGNGSAQSTRHALSSPNSAIHPPAVRVDHRAVSTPTSFSTPGRFGHPEPIHVLDDQSHGLLAEASALEQRGRWGEAMTLYEDALRDHPDWTDLEERLLVARFHFDVRRRYVDARYRDAVQTMALPEATDLYREVLYKIESHYFEDPQWSLLLRRGAENLQVALTERSFLQHHRLEHRATDLATFRDKLDRFMPQFKAYDRNAAVAYVEAVARHAQADLRLSPTATTMEFLCGATGSLDNYSAFLTNTQLDEVYQQIEGHFVGLGVELKPRDADLYIVDVISRGPAEQAGIRPGDRIVAVDRTEVTAATANEVADMLRGPEGSHVRVTLLRPDDTRQTVSIERRRVEVPSVDEVKMIDTGSGIAYLRINSFQKTTSRDMDAALWKLHRNGMRSLIIDLRGNPGGLLSEGVEVADRFITDGTIVSTRGRSARENYDYKAHRAGTWRVPLVVLINRDSASASEIFAAAMRDHHRAVVVGQRSYGKGSVQGIFPLAGGGTGLRLTTARFYSPSGHKISGVGVRPDPRQTFPSSPDRSIANRVDRPTAAIDVSLSAAIEVARQKATHRSS